ncbi:MAG: superoxide dismutase family protein [Vampirovibrionales bacterium]|nr:superoxide dismutase family protein [Vampirovibrionales bacterium]
MNKNLPQSLFNWHSLACVGVIAALALSLPAFSEGSDVKNTAEKSAMTHRRAVADVMDAQGKSLGKADFTETAQGVLIHAQLSGVPEGWHGFHVHAVGQCDPKAAKGAFTSAGGHFNPAGKEHGFENPKGMHVGDLPNVYVEKDGKLLTETLLQGATLESGPTALLDKDGSALVIHSTKDDYASDPAGNAGSRIACGVIQ